MAESTGTMACPICGISRPHTHTTQENNLYHDAQLLHALLAERLPVKINYHYDPQRSYGGRAMACDSCLKINDTHSNDCKAVKYVLDFTERLARLRLAEFKLSNEEPRYAPADAPENEGKGEVSR